MMRKTSIATIMIMMKSYSYANQDSDIDIKSSIGDNSEKVNKTVIHIVVINTIMHIIIHHLF